MKFPSTISSQPPLRPARRGTRLDRRRRVARRLLLESLEDRRLLAFNVLATYETDWSPYELALARIDADSQLDLVVAYGGASAVSVRLGSGDGAFGGPLEAGAGGRSLAAGDFTGDGVTDLATSNLGVATLQVGNEDGTFQTPQAIALPSQIPPAYYPQAYGATPVIHSSDSVVTGDLNGDGKLDLVVGSHTAFSVFWGCGYYSCGYTDYLDGYVNVLLGNGDGTFIYADADPSDADLDAHHLGAYRTPAAVAAADLNNDGKLDIIAANYNGNLSVLLGDGAGALGAPIHSGSIDASASLSFGDLDGDGVLDTVTRSGSTLIVQKGQGDGRFVPSATVNLSHVADSAVVGDVNGDGKLDLAAVGTAFSCTGGGHYGYYGYYYCSDGYYSQLSAVVLGNGQGGFSLPITSSHGANGDFSIFADVALADLNGDGLPDLATIDSQQRIATIASNDGNWTAPVELSISDVSVIEGHSGAVSAAFTVTLSGDPNGPVSVDYSTMDYYSAAAGDDYQAQSGTLLFGPGVWSQTITVLVNGDRNGEGDETFLVNLSNPGNALIKDGQGAGTILDDEPAISIDHSYGINPLTVIEGDVGTTPAVFTVSLSAPYDQEVTVDYSTLTGHTNDIISTAGTLRFAPGETSMTIAVQVVGDRLAEDLEAFNLILADATANASIAVGDGYCFIEDNDPPLPSISIGDASVVEGDSGTRLMTFTVGLSQASSDTVRVNYRTANGTAKTGNKDYVSKSGSTVFAPGETTKTITITVKGDKKQEQDEYFFVNLSGAINGEISNGQGVGTILNDDGGARRSAQNQAASAVDLVIEEFMTGRKKRRSG